MLLMVCLGAAVGAPARYLTDRAIQARHDTVFPWGTLTVNVVGSFILGLVVGLATRHGVPAEVLALVGTGFCGALTTYSTFGFETLRLAEDGARFYALVNVVGSVFGGFGAAVVGYALGQAISPPRARRAVRPEPGRRVGG
jgi:fluoride exporter